LLLFLSPASLASLFVELKNNVESKENNIEKAHLLDSALEPENSLSLTEQAEYWHNLGINLEKQHKMLEAKSAFTKSIDIYLKNNLSETETLINAFIMRARVTSNIDHFNKTDCKDREQALSISRRIKKPNLIAKSIAYYAKCLQSEEHGMSKGLKLYDEAFNIAKQHQLPENIKQVIYNQAASLAFRSLMYEKAYEYNMLAYKSFTQTNDIKSIYNSILNAIHYSTALANTKLAWQHLAELDDFSNEHPKLKDAKLKFNYLSAKVAELDNNLALSIQYLEAGLTEITNSQNVSYIQATYELLSINYFKIGEIDKSYQTLLAVEKLYPNKKSIKKEVLLIKGVMSSKPQDIVKSALKLIDKEKHSKNNFVKQSTIQSAQLFDDNLKQLDNIKLEQRLTIVIVSTIFIILLLVGFSYLQMQRKKLALKETHLMDKLLTKKNQLLGDVSHELTTPLTVLKLQVELLKDDLEEDVQASYQALDNKIDDIQHLIADISQLAQSDVGELQLNIASFELNQSLALWEAELTQFVNKNKLTFEINKSLPDKLMVDFDPDRIKQIFTNLLTNSIKYTHKPGQVKLSAKVKNNKLNLSIEDSAPGVSDLDLINIFERLYRVESSRSRETGGSGLGLAICKSLIEEHNGKIFAEHSDLGGLKIVMELPIN
jgi:signal transduction histidine kinase